MKLLQRVFFVSKVLDIFVLGFMDGFMIYIVEKGLIKGFELGMEICLQTTPQVLSIYEFLGRDEQVTKLSGGRSRRSQMQHTHHPPQVHHHTLRFLKHQHSPSVCPASTFLPGFWSLPVPSMGPLIAVLSHWCSLQTLAE